VIGALAELEPRGAAPDDQWLCPCHVVFCCFSEANARHHEAAFEAHGLS
jgi:hypothetical protein